MKLKINAQEKTIKASDLFNDCTKDWVAIAEELIGYANDNKDFTFFIDSKDCLGTQSFHELFKETTNIIAETGEVSHKFNPTALYNSVWGLTEQINHDAYCGVVSAMNGAIGEISCSTYDGVRIFQNTYRQLLALYKGDVAKGIALLSSKKSNYGGSFRKYVKIGSVVPRKIRFTPGGGDIYLRFASETEETAKYWYEDRMKWKRDCLREPKEEKGCCKFPCSAMRPVNTKKFAKEANLPHFTQEVQSYVYAPNDSNYCYSQVYVTFPKQELFRLITRGEAAARYDFDYDSDFGGIGDGNTKFYLTPPCWEQVVSY